MLPKAFPLKMMLSGDSETYLGPSSHRFFHKMIISPSPSLWKLFRTEILSPSLPLTWHSPSFSSVLMPPGPKVGNFLLLCFLSTPAGGTALLHKVDNLSKSFPQKCITPSFSSHMAAYGSQISSSFSVWTESSLVSNFSCHNSKLFPIQKLHHTGCKPAS